MSLRSLTTGTEAIEDVQRLGDQSSRVRRDVIDTLVQFVDVVAQS